MDTSVVTIPVNMLSGSFGAGIPLQETTATSSGDFRIASNPVNSLLVLYGNSGYIGNLEITVMDILGKKIKVITDKKLSRQHITAITVYGLQTGIYFLAIRINNNKLITLRFLKE